MLLGHRTLEELFFSMQIVDPTNDDSNYFEKLQENGGEAQNKWLVDSSISMNYSGKGSCTFCVKIYVLPRFAPWLDEAYMNVHLHET